MAASLAPAKMILQLREKQKKSRADTSAQFYKQVFYINLSPCLKVSPSQPAPL